MLIFNQSHNISLPNLSVCRRIYEVPSITNGYYYSKSRLLWLNAVDRFLVHKMNNVGAMHNDLGCKDQDFQKKITVRNHHSGP